MPCITEEKLLYYCLFIGGCSLPLMFTVYSSYLPIFTTNHTIPHRLQHMESFVCTVCCLPDMITRVAQTAV